MRGLVGIKSRRSIWNKSSLGSAQWNAGDSPGTLLRFEDGGEGFGARSCVCLVSSGGADSLTAETASNSSSDAMQRSVEVFIENVGEFGTDVRKLLTGFYVIVFL